MKPPVSSRQRGAAFRRSGAKPAEPSTNGNGQLSPTTQKPRHRHYIHQYINWLWPHRFTIAGLLVLALITAVMDMVWPWAIKYIIDDVLVVPKGAWLDGAPMPQRLRFLTFLGVGIILLLIVKQSLDSSRHYRLAVLDAKVTVRLRRRLFERLLGLPLTDLSEMKSGGIVSRLGTDVDQAAGLVQMAFISPAVAIIRVVLTIGILVALSWRLAIAALVMTPPLALISYFWLRKVRPIYRSAQEDRVNIDARVGETFGGIRVVRSFRREPREEREYGVAHHTIIRKGLFANRLELILEAGWGLLIPATSLLIVWYGGYLVLQGPDKGKIGDIFAFQIYAVLLLQPVWEIVRTVSQTQKSLAAMERVFDTLAMPIDKPDSPNATAAPQQVREITFDHVTFEYRPGIPVIRDFTLTVPGGATVALVGPSGAGKTTLTDLVARFYDPTSGNIRLNGTDLRNLRLQTYRRLLAVVQQDTFLFDGTVRDNIAYGRRGATEDQIIDAARRANAHTFISQLPEAYDTLIGERGFKLSGGQKQRLSIARAILADPRILILDEATSNLDTESEQLIQASLADLFKSRTTFVIAHRLSTVTHADLIVVLEDGQIREVGTHADLMQRQGMYYDMVERQRQSFSADVPGLR